jgi:hypothetical protein
MCNICFTIVEDMKKQDASPSIRIDQIKKSLRDLGIFHYVEKFCAMYPEYNNNSGLNRIRNVMGKIVVDIQLIKKLELFVEAQKPVTANK